MQSALGHYHKGRSRYSTSREISSLQFLPDLVTWLILYGKVAFCPQKLYCEWAQGNWDNSRVAALAIGVASMLFAILTVALIVTAVLWAMGIL
jgi:hypothetical protein